jgi:hypothetical protein
MKSMSNRRESDDLFALTPQPPLPILGEGEQEIRGAFSLSQAWATVCTQILQTPSNSPLVRGRTSVACLEHNGIWHFPPLQGGTKGGSDCKGFRYLCVYHSQAWERGWGEGKTDLNSPQ